MYLLQDERFRDHRTGSNHPESARRLEAIDRGLNEAFSKQSRVRARPAKRNELTSLHTRKHVRTVRQASRQEQPLDADTPTSRKSYDTAMLAVGGSMRLARRSVDENTGGFGAVRPPGHHAESERSMGFCLFNNIALVAEALTGADRTVAIVDIDCHHGNGTQKLFYERSDVLYVSFHQHPFYPGTGFAGETGEADGEGFTLNVPMPAGADWSNLEEAWTGSIRERVVSFDPDVLLVSAGFDGHEDDPVGGLRLRDENYVRMAEDLARWSRDLCGGARMALLEGGYDLDMLERVVPAFVEAFCRDS